MEKEIVKQFEFGHLPTHLHGIAGDFYGLICSLCAQLKPEDELALMANKLLDARDAAIGIELISSN